ncbi:hypothetical protein BLA24_25790 [Streptomyces cinnamoneus]|uniref:Uncharacterized protein n=1 Tax=Streptomyces cinnamoneus TaxID=53446 RepID=A0A2G1XE00_STRCJ|nr:hypothetical protein [Streptomyces cinnamoneus]PHQ49456.1 hypothetical protein BLA24_25790 [Streptomyces cinnamoneus]PPT14894.1 hypothetical protein CYQ11_20280 [Streptomyces cinnamoneus]
MNTEACVECGDVPELLDEDLTCGFCRISLYLKDSLMNMTVKFPVETVTHGEIEIDIDVPEEFLDEDGELRDEDGLRDWLNDNEHEWYELDPVFEEIQSKEVIEIANAF